MGLYEREALLPQQRQYAQEKLRCLLETKSGAEFENLFHQLMELRHGDYMQVRTHGQLGDLGADGLRTGVRRLYACYAPETFDIGKVRAKFHSDVSSAIMHRPEQFDTFVFVHNDRRGGIHPVVSSLLVNAHTDFPDITFQQMGPNKLWIEAAYLDRVQMEHLIGEAIPINPVVYAIGLADIEPLLTHLAENRRPDAIVGSIPIPTVYKVDFNKLSQDARETLQSGRPYSYLVDEYYRGLLDPRERDEAAAAFRAYYHAMRSMHGDDTDEILWEMEGYVLGQERPRPSRGAAAKAVLAYFFDECDIFDVPPPGWRPTYPSGGAT
ncbi:ABC-three component system protein [Nocardia macrotermitis]|uniref:ABC-three component systems C-terminal domain-containing protein n=1 Tax=Nocardia macrotermitis TaxID=2585198 RepID=A0A7K0CYP6_9NOCA|nr:ABC-three component system protein [Nocardia macrotermitis]MQY18072.1 hypothetical protein [Nocardia macrotermitis]